jgi:hypothetical protein
MKLALFRRALALFLNLNLKLTTPLTKNYAYGIIMLSECYDLMVIFPHEVIMVLIVVIGSSL